MPEGATVQPEAGGDDAEVTPVPIPNTEVKLCSADDTWREAAWESRKPPAKMKSSPFGLLFSFLIFCGSCGMIKIWDKSEFSGALIGH